MLKIIRKLRNFRKPALFIPWLFPSQPCESFFKRARSMSTTFSTVVNCSMLDFIHRVSRIDFQGEIESRLSDEGYIFPQYYRNKTAGARTEHNLISMELPSDQDIFRILQEALDEANSIAMWMEMDVDEDLKSPSLSTVTIVEKCYDESEIPYQDPSPILTEAYFITEEESENHIPEDSSYVLHRDSDQKLGKIRKSTLCWLLSTEGTKLSSDRLQRVKCNVNNQKSMFNHWENVQVLVEDTISRGAWCTFQDVVKHDAVSIGQVVEFSYLTGTAAQRRYTLAFAPTQPPPNADKGLGCYCIWYKCSKDGILKVFDQFHKFHDIQNYVCTIPDPTLDQDGNFKISRLVINSIWDAINNL
ncbi:hypothetical protein FOCC_FOCC012851 [Frankliniella occidentalis]|nr:hypothetical protein FOCC_FOCC012851 [Frankliniella occidentalis]